MSWLFFPSSAAPAAVSFVAKSTEYLGTSNATTHTQTGVTFTTANLNKKQVVIVTTNSATPSGVTQNGVALTQVGSTVTSSFITLGVWYLDDASMSDGNLVATVASNNLYMVSLEYKDAPQGAATQEGTDSNTTGTVSAALTSVAAGALVIAGAGNINYSPTTFTQGGTTTGRAERSDFGSGTGAAWAQVASDIVNSAGGTVTMTEIATDAVRGVLKAVEWS